MPRFIIHHITRYTYAEPVRDSANQILLYPIKDEYQEVLSQQLSITRDPSVQIFKDYYGNEAGVFMNVSPHAELKIDSTIVVVTKERLFPSDEVPIVTQWDYLSEIKHVVPFVDFLKQEKFEASAEVKKVADGGFYKSVSVFVAVLQLNQYVYQNFRYIKGITSVETTLDEIWNLKAGVCQDFAHILLAMLRLLNIPARYVSGYVCPHDHNLRGEGATHAWVEAYVPFYGWLGLDPTNNCVVNDLHVRLAIGRNFTDCTPVKGTYKGTSKQILEVGVSVSYESGAVPKELVATLTPQMSAVALENDGLTNNSYQRYMAMQQQQ